MIISSGDQSKGSKFQEKWQWCSERWQRLFPWLASKTTDDGGLCVFRAPCKQLGFAKVFNTEKTLQKSHFQEHETCKRHKASMSDPNVRMSLMAPPLELFIHALREVRAGRAIDGTQDVKRKKLVKIKFCLAEALRMQTRRKLQDQCTLTLHSDASKARLLLRAQGCTAETQQPMHAVMGTLPTQNGSDAASIAKSVLAILGDLSLPKDLRVSVRWLAPRTPRTC